MIGSHEIDVVDPCKRLQDRDMLHKSQRSGCCKESQPAYAQLPSVGGSSEDGSLHLDGSGCGPVSSVVIMRSSNPTSQCPANLPNSSLLTTKSQGMSFSSTQPVRESPPRLPSRQGETLGATSIPVDGMDSANGGVNMVLPIAKPPTTAGIEDLWARVELLRTKKLCYHCMKRRWQHSQLPVCAECQPRLRRVTCRHCGDQVLEHRILLKAEECIAASVCLPCAKSFMELGLPTRCDICHRWSAFGSTSHCRRCTEFTAQYGLPTKCVRCGIDAAFRREPEKMQKVGGQLLCFVCTVAFKKERYNEEKRKRKLDSHPAQEKKNKTFHDAKCASCEENQRKLESLQSQLREEKQKNEILTQEASNLRDALEQKDEHLSAFVQQMEREHLLVRREVEETHRKTVRDELRVTQLLKQISDLDRCHAKEVALLIEGNQEERQKLSEVIEKIQRKHETLQAEADRQRLASEGLVARLREKDKAFEQYRAQATQRVDRLSQKYTRALEKQEQRLVAAKQTIKNLKQCIAKLENDHDPVMSSTVTCESSPEHPDVVDNEDNESLHQVSSALYELLSQPPPTSLVNAGDEEASGEERARWISLDNDQYDAVSPQRTAVAVDALEESPLVGGGFSSSSSLPCNSDGSLLLMGKADEAAVAVSTPLYDFIRDHNKGRSPSDSLLSRGGSAERQVDYICL